MAHSQQYVSQALKMYTSIQPYVAPVITEPDIIDVEFRELPPTTEMVVRNEVQRLMTIVRHKHLF